MELIKRQSRRWTALRQEFIDAQGGLCAICRERMEKPNLDHCHASGFVRGALCNGCNVMLGWYETRRKAIESYIARAAEFQAYEIIEHTPRRKAWQSKFPTKSGLHLRRPEQMIRRHRDSEHIGCLVP